MQHRAEVGIRALKQNAFAVVARAAAGEDVTITGAVRRVAPNRAVEARAVLDSITLLEVTSSLCEAAGRLQPASLRTLDAIHLAAALALGDDLDSIVTYDDRLAQCAELHGVPVTSPVAPR